MIRCLSGAERVAIASRPAHCAASNSERAVRARAVRAAGVAGWRTARAARRAAVDPACATR